MNAPFNTDTWREEGLLRVTLDVPHLDPSGPSVWYSQETYYLRCFDIREIREQLRQGQAENDIPF